MTRLPTHTHTESVATSIIPSSTTDVPKTAGKYIIHKLYDVSITNAHQVEKVMQTLQMLGSLELHLLLVVCTPKIVGYTGWCWLIQTTWLLVVILGSYSPHVSFPQRNYLRNQQCQTKVRPRIVTWVSITHGIVQVNLPAEMFWIKWRSWRKNS